MVPEGTSNLTPNAATSDDILFEFTTLFIAYKDGRITRLVGTDIIPASVDPDTGTQSKDVEIEPNENLLARVYLPKNASSGHKLPLLVYFHGGGFVVESAFCGLYHNHLNLLVAETNVVVVSVNYRKAPEYPLPIAYEDSWLGLKWVASHFKGEGSETWLNEYADPDRVYLGGDSAGGNIAHNMAVRYGLEKIDGINIIGMFLNCPYFESKSVMGNEYLQPKWKTLMDELWPFACPASSGLDDPLINPTMDPNLSSLGCKRVLVYVGEEDVLKDRGWWYKETLCKSGWIGDAEVVEVEGEDHVFNLYSPTSENSISMMKKLTHFLNEL